MGVKNITKSLAAISVSLAAISASMVQAEESKCSPAYGMINVVGEGEVKVMPDQAKLEYSVTALKPTAQEARNKVEKSVTAFANAITDLQLGHNSFVANSLNIYPRYVYDENTKRQQLTGYEASRRVTVTVNDFALIGKVNDMAIKSGINQVAGYEYSLSNQEQYEKEATQKAIAHAKEQAKLLALGFDVDLGKPCAITYNRMNRPMPLRAAAPRAMMASDAPMVESTYSVEPLVISASVNASFSINKRSFLK